MLSSMRLILLERAATLLRRWLRTVTTQLEPAAPPSVAPAPSPTPSPAPRAAASSRPAPPDHWVELVQQYAPQLLEPVDPVVGSTEPDATPSLDSVTGSDRKGTTGESHSIPGGNIVDYRKGAPKSSPAPLRPSAPRPIDVAQRRSSPQRPLRLDQVNARTIDALEVEIRSAEGRTDAFSPPTTTNDTPAAEPPTVEWRPFSPEPIEDTSARPLETAQIEPPTVRTSVRTVEMGRQGRVSRLFSRVRLARHKPTPTPPLAVDVDASRRDREALDLPVRRSAEQPAPPIHTTPTQPDAAGATPVHFSPNLPLERQHIRERLTSVPSSASVPTIRTSAGQAPQIYQGRTGTFNRLSPPQTVLRPTLPSLKLGDVTPDRWPSLPDEPAEAPRDPSLERQRRERLNREQEGSAWNE